MMGLLTEFDYEIKQKADEIGTARESSTYQFKPEGDDTDESPIMKELKKIKIKLNSIDIRKSIQDNSYE